MEYLALYRRYRPDTFEKLIGQDAIVKTLINQIESGRLGHAYLFTGTRGTGKTSAAKIFAKAINCTNPQNGSPCGKCECCKALSEPSQIDVVEIDAASNNGVNEIRDLREKVQYPPVSCKYKVYIIDEVHMLSGPAFNALLKTLEEPPKHVVFILATTEVQKIPATILSRCMRFDFRLIPTEKIAALISGIYDELGKKYEKEAVTAIAAAGEGSIRDALSIADIALSFGDGVLTYNDVMEILGATNIEDVIDLVRSILTGDTGKVLSIIDALSRVGKSTGVLIKDVIKIVRNLLVITSLSQPNDVLCLPINVFAELKSLAMDTDSDRLLLILDILNRAEGELRYASAPRTVFETAMIKAAKPCSDYDSDALLTRIKTLEDTVEQLKSGVIYKSENENKPSENIKTETLNEENIAQEKSAKKISDNVGTLKGEILKNLRLNGHEMLWRLIENVGVNAVENILILSVQTESDFEILNRDDNKLFIKEALTEYDNFEIQVKIASEINASGEMEDVAEYLKSILGDDTVIID